jgi:hypothetical protein
MDSVMHMLLHIYNLQKQKQYLHMLIVYFTFYGRATCGICPNHITAGNDQ